MLAAAKIMVLLARALNGVIAAASTLFGGHFIRLLDKSDN